MASKADVPVDLPHASGGARLGAPAVVIVLPPTPDGSSFEAWRHHLTFACSAELVSLDDLAAFHASTRLYMLGRFIVSDSTSSHATWLARTGADAARTGVDHVNISLHLEGDYAGRCGARAFHARQGDVSFIDFGLPFAFQTSPYRTLALTVPRSAMPAALLERAVHGFVPDASLPATRLLAQMMREVHAALPGLTQAQAVIAAGAIVELAVAATHGDLGAREEPTTADLDLLSRAQAEIERAAGEASLSVNALARRLGVTRSALYSAFASYNGVLAYIRERRLQRCYEMINGGAHAGETLGAIAFSCGFRSEAHFSRAFRERFGMPPRELRSVARQRGVNMLPPTTAGVAPEAVQRLGR